MTMQINSKNAGSSAHSPGATCNSCALSCFKDQLKASSSLSQVESYAEQLRAVLEKMLAAFGQGKTPAEREAKVTPFKNEFRNLYASMLKGADTDQKMDDVVAALDIILENHNVNDELFAILMKKGA